MWNGLLMVYGGLGSQASMIDVVGQAKSKKRDEDDNQKTPACHLLNHVLQSGGRFGGFLGPKVPPKDSKSSGV